MTERFQVSAELATRGYDAQGRARPERLDRALAALFPDTSRAELQRWIREELITRNGSSCKAADTLREGDVIEVTRGAPLLSSAVPDPSVVLNVVFEDEHLLVVDKPAGLVIHPGAGHPTGTLVNGLLARPGFEAPPIDERDPEGYRRPGIVHRLDRDTSGLLVVAKQALTREGLKTQFADHSIQREYVALTNGVPCPGRIDTWHGRSPLHRQRFTSLVSRGKRAVTRIEVLENLTVAALVSCRLETGRTHQIRVHLLEQCQTPILADPVYGKKSRNQSLVVIAERLGRQALHARELGFQHPVTGESLMFRSELPGDFAEALESLRSLS